jgi:hypothetical protein
MTISIRELKKEINIKKQKMENNLELHHEELLESEDMSVKDLPSNLQQQIRGFNLQKKKYEQNPVENQKFRLTRLSLELAEKIQNYIDKMDDEDEGEDEDLQEKKQVEKQNKKPAETPKKENKKVGGEVAQNESRKSVVKSGFGNFVMEKKILSITNAKKGKIGITDLAKIIGKEPDYPEQMVNNLKLRKVFLSSDYRIV